MKKIATYNLVWLGTIHADLNNVKPSEKHFDEYLVTIGLRAAYIGWSTKFENFLLRHENVSIHDMVLDFALSDSRVIRLKMAISEEMTNCYRRDGQHDLFGVISARQSQIRYGLPIRCHNHPSPSGIEVSLNKNTKHNQKVKLSGLGLPKSETEYGDLTVQVIITRSTLGQYVFDFIRGMFHKLRNRERSLMRENHGCW